MSQPTNRTSDLLAVGQVYLTQHPVDGFVCAAAGGSVGRGEADVYSDLNLNLYVSHDTQSVSTNEEFEGEILQLHTHTLPATEKIQAAPWGFRFLSEGRSVSDPTGAHRDLKSSAISYFSSHSGHRRMVKAAKAAVESRKDWKVHSLAAGKMLSSFERFVDWLRDTSASEGMHFLPQQAYVCTSSTPNGMDFVGHFETLAARGKSHF